MATRLKTPIDADDELAKLIEDAARNDDGAAARDHLAAGHPIYYCEADTPAGLVVKKHPNGQRELVRLDLHGEHIVQPIA